MQQLGRHKCVQHGTQHGTYAVWFLDLAMTLCERLSALRSRQSHCVSEQNAALERHKLRSQMRERGRGGGEEDHVSKLFGKP